jgi:hypothetical protein
VLELLADVVEGLLRRADRVRSTRRGSPAHLHFSGLNMRNALCVLFAAFALLSSRPRGGWE